MKKLLMLLVILILGSCQVQRPMRVYRYNDWYPNSWFFYNQPTLVPSYRFPVYVYPRINVYPNRPTQRVQPSPRRDSRTTPSRTPSRTTQPRSIQPSRTPSGTTQPRSILPSRTPPGTTQPRSTQPSRRNVTPRSSNQ